MKKIILLLLLLISTIISGQSLKGDLKKGGFQEGKPFSIVYSNVKIGTYNEYTESYNQNVDRNSTVFFNYNNSNKIKVVFPDGQDNILFNIKNIKNETSSYFGLISEADANHKDIENGKAKIRFTEKDFQILITESKTVILFSYPKK
jgi:hypothetical protein